MNENELLKANIEQIVSETDPFTLERYMLFAKRIKNTQPIILDYGCNIGRGGEYLRKIFADAHLIGADILEERLQRIPALIYNKLINLNKENIVNTIDKVDIIVSGEVVEHIPFNQFVNTLKEFYSILNKNGILLITTPNPNSILVKLGRHAVLKDPSHINIMEPNFLKTLIKKIGFFDVKVLGSGKATRFLGQQFPMLCLYGSYMIIARK